MVLANVSVFGDTSIHINCKGLDLSCMFPGIYGMHYTFNFVKVRFVLEFYIISLVINDKCVPGYVVVGFTFFHRGTSAHFWDIFR
jgi:hypothetical protein